MSWESIATSVAGGLIANLFGGGGDSQPAPAAPKVEPVTPMPTPNDAAVKDAKRKSIAAMAARQGRASTILTGNEDATGGVGSTLGG